MAGLTPRSWWGDTLQAKLSAGAGEVAGADKATKKRSSCSREGGGGLRASPQLWLNLASNNRLPDEHSARMRQCQVLGAFWWHACAGIQNLCSSPKMTRPVELKDIHQPQFPNRPGVFPCEDACLPPGRHQPPEQLVPLCTYHLF